MIFGTSLISGEKEFDASDCDYKLERDADGKDRPTADIYGGKVRVRVDSAEDSSVLERAVSRFKPISGSVAFGKRETRSLNMKNE